MINIIKQPFTTIIFITRFNISPKIFWRIRRKKCIFAARNGKGMTKKKALKIDSSTRRDLYDKFSDYALDLSKLVFGGVILAGIMGLNVNTNLLFILGAVTVTILTVTGYIFIVLKHNSRR